MRSKVFIAVLVALAMLLSFGVAVKNAQADAILFPWVVKSSAVSTLVSVVNTAGKSVVSHDYEPVLHYQYYYKKTTANGQTEACEPVSFKRPTSKDDIVTFDAAGNINGGKALFGDPSPYGGASFKLTADSPRRAFLIVDNNTPAFIAPDAVNVDGTLYGEAMLLEIAGGAAWGYIAYNASGGQESSQTTTVDFQDTLDVLGEVISYDEWTQTTLLPPNLITTKIFVTPIDDDAGARIGTANTRVQLFVMDAFGFWYGGIYDNDENIIDFDKKKNIVCTSADTLDQFMTSAAYDMFKTTGGQGWSYIWTWDGTIDANRETVAEPVNPETQVIIGKLEYTTTGITIDGKTVPGTLNNFVWLRNSATVTDYVGINCIENWTPGKVTWCTRP